VYEVLWTKYLSLTFGTTMIAISIVAATFMAGLAIGSYLLGRYADREVNLLRVYACLEIGIALFALLFPPTLAVVTDFHTAVERLFPGLPVIGHLTHFTFSALLLVPPTVCMGGTFPVMCRFFAQKKSNRQIGLLYALNTFGAMLGAFVSGYCLIPYLGLSTSGYLAALTNLTIAGIAFFLAHRIGTAPTPQPSETKSPSLPNLTVHHRLILVAIALVGFFSLAYEILWTRVFLLFLGNTSYAFSMILSAFLVSLALGGILYSYLSRRGIDDRAIFTLLSFLMGLFILATVPFYDNLAHFFQFAHQASGERWWHLTLLSFILVFCVVSLPTVFSGCLLPAAVAILDPGKVRTGEGVGLIVLHNTVGAVLGSLAAGFLLIPWLGTLASFRTLATLNVLMAAVLYFHYRQKLPWPRMAPALLALGLVPALLPASWDPGLMNSGVYIYAPKYERMGGLKNVLHREMIITTIEGIDTSVAVHEGKGGSFRFFTVNGKTDGGTGSDMATQVLVGQLPMLLHSSPEEVLVIGLGTGITLRGLSDHPTQRIRCVEISPEVVEASAYFTGVNGNVLADPKVALSIEDGRNLLLTWPKQYDVIISEPSNPWQSGNANLFTTDFYRLAARRLKEGGLFCQWIGLYDITPGNLRIATRTFLDTFPWAMVFRVGADLVMVGAQHDLKFDYLALETRLAVPGVADTLARIGITSPGALIGKYYLYSEGSLENFSRGARLNSDDHPILEYSARYLLGEKTLGELQTRNLTALKRAAANALLPLANLGTSKEEVARALREIAQGFSKGGNRSAAEHFMRKAAELEGSKDG
jgi:spermidine synthase